jgi:hypothetical protein
MDAKNGFCKTAAGKGFNLSQPPMGGGIVLLQNFFCFFSLATIVSISPTN